MAASFEPMHPVTRLPIPISEIELVIMMALTQALMALAIDTMLPALGDIARDMTVPDPNRRQLVIGIYLLGSGIGSLLPGAVADRYGRRRVLLSCISGYVLLSMACALTTSFAMLLAVRMVQGMICAGLTVLPSAIIRDRFDGDRMAKLQSLISVISLTVPMLAPALGQAILLFAGWRWIFGMMAVLGACMTVWVLIRLPETLNPAYRQRIHIAAISSNMWATLINRASIGYVLGSACVMGVMFGYIQSSQQLLGEHFGAGHRYPLFFGCMALAMAVANFGNAGIVERFGARRVSHTALLLYIATALLQFRLAASGHETLWQFVPLMTFTMMLIGFMGANFGSISLQPFARIAGAAASVQSFLRLILASLFGVLIGQAYDQTALPIAEALVMAGIVTLALVLFSENGRLFRRLHPKGAPRPV